MAPASGDLGARPGVQLRRNRRYLQRAGGSYIIGEKLRGSSQEAAAALARQGRYHPVAGNLRVKQVRVDDGVARDRFIICHNPEEARRDAEIRAQIVARLEDEIATADTLGGRGRAELAGRLTTKPAFNRFLRTTPTGRLRIDRSAVRRDAHYDGKYLLRTADESLTPDDIAQAYKALYQPSVAGVTSRPSRSTSGRCSTARTNGSKPTSNCAGWRCCCCGSPNSPSATPGATSATSSTGCTSSPSPPPKAASPSAPN